MSSRGESFRLSMPYFTEQQRGQMLDLTLEYGYAGVLPLEEMPDYRLIQLLVEELLYVYDEEWVDIFWEMQNRELVHRLLVAFPQIGWARCEMAVRPSALLPLPRSSIVHWSREDLPALGEPRGSYSRPLPDACWYSSGDPAVFRIGAPRVLQGALAELYTKLQPVANVDFTFLPTPCQSVGGAFEEMLRLAEQFERYDAFILPRPAQHELQRCAEAGTTSESRTRNLLIPRLLPADQEIMSSHLAPGNLGTLGDALVVVGRDAASHDAATPGASDPLVCALLGGPKANGGFAPHPLFEARAGFFPGMPSKHQFARLLLEKRFASPHTLRAPPPPHCTGRAAPPRAPPRAKRRLVLAGKFDVRPAFADTTLELCLARRLTPERAAECVKAFNAARA
jgi:hypothetical protein